MHEKEIKGEIHKTLLPNYDVFDEYRYFEPAFDWKVLEFKGKKLAVTICEDIWNMGDNPLYRITPMEKLMPWAKEKGLKVIEDCAHTAGGVYNEKMLGTWGDIGTSSFYPAHHITMGEGGAVYTNNLLLKKILLSIVRLFASLRLGRSGSDFREIGLLLKALFKIGKQS